MVDEALVVFFPTAELLLQPTTESAGDGLSGCRVELVHALYHSHLSLMTYVLRIDIAERRLAEREVVNSIEHIGLAHAVLSHKAVDIRRESQVGRLDVAIVEYVQFSKIHGALSCL